MNRSKFLASLAAILVAPFVKADTPAKKIPPPMPKTNRFAYDLAAVPQGLTAREVLQIYNDTGVLLYQSQPHWHPDYHGVQMFEGDVEVKEYGEVRRS